jgi:hypothetical protein
VGTLGKPGSGPVARRTQRTAPAAARPDSQPLPFSEDATA